MADGVTIPATGSGTATPLVATDDAGAAGHVQFVKLAISTDASATPIPADATAGLATDPTDDALRDLGKVDVASLDQYTPVAGRLPVDGSGVTQPVSAAALPLPTGAATSALQLPDGHNVTVDNAAGASAVNIQDGGNAITVDGTVTANLSAGTNTNEVVGDVAEHIALAGNPVRIAIRASTAVPAAMSADGDAVTPWGNRSGAPVVTHAPHVGLNSDPWNLVHEGAQYTAQQTSTVFAAGGASEKIVATVCQIQAFGTTAFDLQIYFGTGAFSRGTSRTIFDGTFKPSTTLAPGVVLNGPFISGTNGDDIMVTTSAAGSVTISIWFYVVT